MDTQKVTDNPALQDTLEMLLARLIHVTTSNEKSYRGLRNGRTAEASGSEEVAVPDIPPLSIPSRHAVLYRWHAKRILLDLLEAYWMDCRGWLRVRRDKNAYRPNTVLGERKFSVDVTVKLVDAMRSEELGWIEYAEGFFLWREEAGSDDETVRGRCARMRATDRLLSLVGHFEHSWIQQEPLPDTVRLVLKDSKGNRKPLLETQEVTMMRLKLMEAEALFSASTVELRLPAGGWDELRDMMFERKVLADLTGNSLFRVFNDGSLERGGRIYGPGYQGIPSKLRCWYYLNGQPTVELDFKCLHPSILYAEAGELIPDDCYDLPGYDGAQYRPLIKRAMNTFINAETKGKAIGSLAHRWEQETKVTSSIRPQKRVWAPLLDTVRTKAEAGRQAASLLNVIKRHHAPIADKFGKGEGTRLQREDARIAEAVLSEAANVNCPIMIFHDGFRVIHAEAETVWRIMRSEFRRLFHQNIRVEAKGATPPLSCPEYEGLAES